MFTGPTVKWFGLCRCVFFDSLPHLDSAAFLRFQTVGFARAAPPFNLPLRSIWARYAFVLARRALAVLLSVA